MARCGGDGGAWVTTTTASTFGAANTSGCPSSIPAASRVRINEVTSDAADTVEVYNGRTSAVGIGSWKYADNDTAHRLPGAFAYADQRWTTASSHPTRTAPLRHPCMLGLLISGPNRSLYADGVMPVSRRISMRRLAAVPSPLCRATTSKRCSPRSINRHARASR